jgi:antitoxin (DNA-binding transcriptional repressor) of toxin-antitoxin stability system
VLITKKGEPVALVVGLDGLDAEQVELGSSSKFWNLIRDRRKEPTISRNQLDAKLKGKGAARSPSRTTRRTRLGD